MTVDHWVCTRDEDGNAHVQPLEDTTEHDPNGDCACGPVVDPTAGESDNPLLITHRSIDDPDAA